MPQTLHGTSSLVRLPDRTLTRLENGVAEITRRYACRTSVASTFRSQFNVGATMPGESGFIIKYGYVERKREDGFTEFEVTAVGPDPSVTDSGGLKAQDDRIVTTFPSGLVRVDRTYVCPTASEATFRRSLGKGLNPPYDDFSPAIDGLYIFPDPNEVRRSDGFTEFRVSSYGRINTTGLIRQITSVTQLETFTVGTESTQYFAAVPINVQELVVPYPFNYFSINYNIYKARSAFVNGIRYRINGGFVNINIGVGTSNQSLGDGSPQIETQNFGFWDQVTINYGF